MSTEQLRQFARVVVLGTWIFGAACFFFPLYDTGIGALGRAVFWLLVCVHAIEFVVFLGLFRQTGEPLGGHFLKTMAYGVIHQSEVKERMAAGGGDGAG